MFQLPFAHVMKPILLDSFPVWLYYPSMIKWKIQQRNLLDKTKVAYLISTINASLIIEMATFWEGIVFEMQSEIFFDRFGQGADGFHESLNRYFDKKLSNATWTTYIEYFDLLIGGKLANKIENENWKAIQVMFNFRNMLVHGKEIEVQYYDDNGRLHADSPYGFNKTFQFLNEKKLLDLSFKPHMNTVDMLNESVVNFFYANVIQFIESLFDIFPDSEVGELKKNFKDCLLY